MTSAARPVAHRLVLLIDDDVAWRAREDALAALGWRALVADDAERALATLGTHDGMQLDAVAMNADRLLRDPASLVRRIRSLRPQLPVVVATGGARSTSVVDALRAGASDYLLLPLDAERLAPALDRAVDGAAEHTELRPLSERLPHRPVLDRAVGSAPAFRAALAIAAKAARARGPLRIEGEAGTGRAWLARAMHAAGPRPDAPFAHVALTGLSADATDRLLFGYPPGAGAHGALVDADGGTLHLSGVASLPLPQQARLVRAMDEGEVQATGSAIRHRIDVRVVASDDGELARLVEAKRVREDLFYKLSATTVELPPLRDRLGDLPALTRDTLRRIADLTGTRPLSVTDGALSLLRRYDWPGNLRQLEGALFRAAAMADGDALTEFDFPALLAQLGEGTGPARVGAGVELFADGELRQLSEIEADVIRLAINHYGGRMSEVARRLGIGRSTLYRKLSDLGIDNAA